MLRQATEGANAEGTYTGANNYIDYRQGFRREHTIGNEKGTGTHGPLRASTNVRMSVRCVGGGCACQPSAGLRLYVTCTFFQPISAGLTAGEQASCSFWHASGSAVYQIEHRFGY